MFVFPGESSFAVCLDSVRKASVWPLCLSGLNCLITVIIWTGRKNHLAPWHHAGLILRGGGALKNKRGFCEGLQRMPGVWSTGLWCIHSHIQDSPHAYTAYIHSHVIRIPHVSGTFRCYQMKKLHVRASVQSEEGPGGCVTYSWLSWWSPSPISPLRTITWVGSKTSSLPFHLLQLTHPV